ncbi:MAG: ATP-binding protein [Acidaminococcaceae bacterium]|nr:ATP-binding protein [Acidaminococcaceae bacterium]
MIKRERYIEKIRPFFNNELVKVLTGIRRAGKSVMLDLIRQELMEEGVSAAQCILFNFESMSNVNYKTAESLYKEIATRIGAVDGRAYLFLDEIQEVTDWEKCINSCRVDFDCDIYITGSNAKLLSGELATYLGGRYVEFVIYPFSFAEYMEAKKRNQGNADMTAGFSDYLSYGGMPFLTNLPDNPSASLQYLKDLYSSVVLKDVVKRNKIRDVDILERIILYVMANVGHTFSARSISSYFKSENRNIAPETILNYLKACADAYLFYPVKREDLIGKKLLTVNEKYYVADHGLREAVYGNNMRDIEQTLENIVCLELIRRGYSVTVGKYGEREVDFIATKREEKIYAQVAYLLATEETVRREFGVYDSIKDNYPKYVVSMDELDFSRNGIRHMNIRKFLMAEDYN